MDRTPAILFTMNRAFLRDRGSTARLRAQSEHLEERADALGIDLGRIEYVGRGKGERGVYVSEKSDLVKRFFRRYGIRSGCVALADGGAAFKDGSRSILTEMGFDRHVVYPSAVHAFLSPNDNSLHGAAKRAWREMDLDWHDDVASSLELLALIDRHTSKVRDYFTRNLQLGARMPSMVGIQAIINIAAGSRSAFHQDCFRTYNIHMAQDARGGVPSAP